MAQRLSRLFGRVDFRILAFLAILSAVVSAGWSVAQISDENNTVDSYNDLINRYLADRDKCFLMCVPDWYLYANQIEEIDGTYGLGGFQGQPDWYVTFDVGDMYFSRKSALAQSVAHDTKLVIYEDMVAGELLVMRDTGSQFVEEIVYRAPAWPETRPSEPYKNYLFRELSKRRVARQVTMKRLDFAAKESDSSPSSQDTTLPNSIGGGSSTMMLLMGGGDELAIAGMKPVTNGLLLNIQYSESFSGTVWSAYSYDVAACVNTNGEGDGGGGSPPLPGEEICTNCPSGCGSTPEDGFLGLERIWTPVFTNLVLTGSTFTAWTDTRSLGMDDATNHINRFYSFGNNEVDTDEDGLCDALEQFTVKTDPEISDTDSDEMPDGWEWQNGSNPLDGGDAAADLDGDGLDSFGEYQNGTDPLDPDTDDDAYNDGYEVLLGTEPLDVVEHPSLVMIINNGEEFTSDTNVTVRFPGYMGDQVTMGERSDLVGGMTTPLAAEVTFNLQGTSNGVRNVYAQLTRNSTTSSIIRGSITFDSVPPVLGGFSPSDGFVTNRRWIKISGLATDALSQVRVFVNEQWAHGGTSTSFWHDRILLHGGTNSLVVSATDYAGNVATQTVHIIQDTTGDTSPPSLVVSLPGQVTNGAPVTYGNSDTLYFSGSTDDETAEVVVYAVVDSITNGPWLAVVSGTQIWCNASLAKGTNRLAVVAADAATNTTSVFCTVVRDTNFFFVITTPKPYQVINSESTVVSGVASLMFSDAVISVNGVAATIITNASNVAFTTVSGVPLSINRSELVGTAVLNGTNFYYTDPTVTGYDVLNYTANEDAEEFYYVTDGCFFRIGTDHLTRKYSWSPVSCYFKEQGHCETDICSTYPDCDGSGPTTSECEDPFSYETGHAAVKPDFSIYMGHYRSLWSWSSGGLTTVLNDEGHIEDIDFHFRKNWPTQELQTVILQFSRIWYERPYRSPLDPTLITYRGQTGFWYNGNVAFIVPIETEVDYSLKESDFTWPSYNNSVNGFTYDGKFMAVGANMSNCVLKIGLVPDWDHDRAITSADENQATASNPFRFWTNDDDDDGNEASGDSDIPGQSGGNYADGEVNGRCDLPDFFPVWLDLHDTLNLLPPSGTVQYKLKQANSAVRAVYTDLSKGSAGAFLTTAGNTYGPSFNQNSYEADTFEVTSSGVTLSTDFLDKIKNDAAKGILLIEGKTTSTAPLVLELWKDGAKICETELPLSIAGVEKMYRWVNLRHVTGGSETRATDTSEPSNYPDSLCNGKHVVFVHGFNSSESGARAWNAEVFKRLYQSGSRAMYTAVTWEGAETLGILPPGAYYHADVINAFQAASALASQVAALPGQKYVAAHSLGNMVMSSAIVDHGLNPTRYFMIDAAVAMEAYKSSERHYTDMAVPPWPDYTNRVWASEWYDLFDDPDGRYYLTWRGRFGNISQAINYYSSGEDVLNNNETGGSVSIFDAPDMVWIFQERVKGGILPAILVGVDSQGGWEFNGDYATGVYDPSNDVYVTATTPAEAALLPEYMLRAHSFSKPFYDDDIYGTNGSTVAADAEVRGKVLAEGIPATSRATGRNPISLTFDENVDLMDFKSGWPRTNGNWLHSDFKNVAYPYLHQFFEDMVSQGGLQ